MSANYYPVTSAIAIRDDTLQFTVMNSRSQGGTVIDSRVELMQNRRMTHSDTAGMTEVLNETDSQGYGIKVRASYTVQVFRKDEEKSLQRDV